MVETDHALTPPNQDLEVNRDLRKINDVLNRPRASAGLRTANYCIENEGIPLFT